MNDRILIVLDLESQDSFLKRALDAARSLQKTAVALQILTSHLYYYGFKDYLAGGRAKTDFLLYIRQEVMERGRKQAAHLLDMAKALRVQLRVKTVETENRVAEIVAEAHKGYDLVIVAREPRRLFPLLHRSLAQEVERKAGCRVLEL